MLKNELDKIKELEKKKLNDTINDDEKLELQTLSGKRAEEENLKSAMGEFFKDKSHLKNMALDIQKFNSAEQQEHSAGYKAHQLLCGIKNGNPDMIKAANPMVEAVPADGGYLVPTITESRILELLPTYGQARKIMNVMPMKGNILQIPKEGTLPTWTWVGENELIPTSKPTFGVFTLTPKKGAGIVVMSSELFEDASPNLGDYIIRKFAQVKGQAEDAQFFRGTGAPFTGIYNSSNTFGNTVTFSGNGSTITYNNLVDMVYGVDPNYLVGARWIISRTTAAAIRKLVDDNNRPIFEPAQNGLPAMLLGYPVEIVENAPTTATASGQTQILLGNFENSWIGDVSGMRIDFMKEATIDGTSLAQYDLVAIRVISRVAMNAGYTEKYSRGRQAV